MSKETEDLFSKVRVTGRSVVGKKIHCGIGEEKSIPRRDIFFPVHLLIIVEVLVSK